MAPINWLLFGELIVVVIVCVAFLFYWNRLVAELVAFSLRLALWRHHHAYISIGSLQISPLAGRIAWRDVEYHSSNMSVRALHGHITWRYWKFRVRQEEDAKSQSVKRNRLPCRITCYAEGVEAFFYNRTPAYDAIVERMKKHEQDAASAKSPTTSSDEAIDGDLAKPIASTTARESTTFKARLRRFAGRKSEAEQTLSDGLRSDDLRRVETQDAVPSSPQSPPQPAAGAVDWFREALPIDFRIVTGAINLGSDATPMVLISDFKQVEGVIQVSESRSKCDKYKMSVDMSFEEPKVLMRTNVDYSGPILPHGKKAYDELLQQEPDLTRHPPSAISSLFGFHFLSRRFPFLHDPKFSSPPVAGLPSDRPWRGLARYRQQDEGAPRPLRKEEREYAKVTTILDSPALDLTYYSDTPGPVPLLEDARVVDEMDEVGNVEPPPEYGIDVVIHGGIVKYGPWADRQRDALQGAFAPSIFFDSVPKARLQPGDIRVHTNLILNIFFSVETTLRIPTREPSKDWMFDHADADAERRYGWLDVSAGANSSIVFTQSQFAMSRGYDAMLALHLDSLQIASSVNLETFIHSKSCKLSITMPTPLQWDAQRDWGFDVTLDTPVVTLLRDHVQLISDLARDWSSGAVGDFHHFVPNHYNFRVILSNYAFHLYINDYNIVDSPRSRDDNAFMDVYGPRMEAYVAVAAVQYRPDKSTVPFSISARDVRVELCVPKWDTHRSFGQGEALEVGKIGEVNVNGSYRYYATPSPDHQEALDLHLEGKRVVYKALGWALRRMFNIKDNYFGSFTQFTTMQEYLERFDHDPNSVGDPVEEKYRPGRSDPFSVFVTMDVTESLILLSDEIYSEERGLVMPVPQLQMNLKSTEHAMELSLDSPPTYIIATPDFNRTYYLGVAPAIKSKEAIFIEGITLKAHRLFGPQPHATTYLCLWECLLPRVTAFLSPQLAMTLRSAVQAVAYNYTDIDNAPASIYVPKTPPDVTFFKLNLSEASMTLFGGHSAVTVSLPDGLLFDTSTQASRTCSSMLAVSVPALKVDLLRRHGASKSWTSAAGARTSMGVDVFKAPRGWSDHVAQQQAFLREQDGPTQRIWYMWKEAEDEGVPHHVDGVYLPRPLAASSVQSSSVEDAPDEADFEKKSAASAHHTSSDPEESDMDEFDGLYSRSLRQRRSRSFATARSHASTASSAGDESDTASSDGASSVTSISQRDDGMGFDMATALAERLHFFHTVENRKPVVLDQAESDQPAGPSLPAKQLIMESGTVVKVFLNDVAIDADLTAVECGLDLAEHITSTIPTGQQCLDSLLIHQTDAVLEQNARQTPLVLELDLKAAHARIFLPIDQALPPPPSLDMMMRGFATRMIKAPTEDEARSDINVAASLHSLNVYARSSSVAPGQITLLDVMTSSEQGGAEIPVARFGLQDVRVDIALEQQRRHLRIEAGRADSDSVAVAVGTIHQMVDSTLSLAASISVPTRPNVAARALYDITRSAVEANVIDSQPAFVIEAAYGLHVDDVRNIRRDLGWTLLARLRQWSRAAPLRGSPPVKPNAPDMVDYVLRELSELEDLVGGDGALLFQQAFLKNALGFNDTAPTADGDDEDKVSSDAFFVTLKDVSLQHHGRLLQSREVAASSMRVLDASLGAQLSSVQRDSQSRRKIRCLAAIKSVDVELRDSLVDTVQRLVPIVKSKRHEDPAPSSSERPAKDSRLTVIVDGHLGVANLSILAGGLRLRTSTSGTRFSFGCKNGHKARKRLSHSDAQRGILQSEFIEIVLSEPMEPAAIGGPVKDRTVLSARAEGVRGVVTAPGSGSAGSDSSTLGIVVGIRSLDFDSRPLPKAFLDFARNWREAHVQHYTPIFDALRNLKSDRPTRAASGRRPQIVTKVDLMLEAFHFQIRAAKSLWIRWDIGKLYGSLDQQGDVIRFGVNIAPQMVGAYASARKGQCRDAPTLRLPSLAVNGTHHNHDKHRQLLATVKLGMFVGVLKPVILDRLLSVHHRLGTDIMDIVHDYRAGLMRTFAARQDRQKLSSSGSGDTEHLTPPKMLFGLQMSVAGVRFGLKADNVASTLLFEALNIHGTVSNQQTENQAMLWSAKVDHFGLSLGHLGNQTLLDETEPIRKHRAAYMVLDIEVNETPGAQDTASELNVNLNHVHTVMHVAALSELSELFRSWQRDIHIINEKRKADVEEVRIQTNRLLKNIQSGGKSSTPQGSWFASRLFNVEVTGLGLAIPLNEGAPIDLRRRNEASVAALLFSIRVIRFHNRRNETARFKMQQLLLQFCDSFDQGMPEHFSGEFHSSMNRMSLPSVDSEAQMKSTPDTWTLASHASATDFKLSLTPDIANGVFQLIDLYHNGKTHISELEQHYRTEVQKQGGQHESVAANHEHDQEVVGPRRHQRILVRMTFTFNSGIVELHKPVSDGERRRVALDGRGPENRSPGQDVFVLPTISVWQDYAGPKFGSVPSHPDQSDDIGESVLNLAVHRSRNVINPSILPFLTDLVNRLEARAKRQAAPSQASGLAAHTGATEDDSLPPQVPVDTKLKVRAKVTLRIDQSELRFSCAPDSNAYVDLKWESGGFMASTTFGGNELSAIAGSVSGVTASLSHEFAEQGRSCIEAGARDLAFSVTHCSNEDGSPNGLSVVLDTQIAAQFRLEAFSAWLIFMSVWVDNAPKLELPLRTAIPDAAASQSQAHNDRRKLAVAALVRFRSIDFDANIAVSRAKLEISPVLLRVTSNGEKTDADLDVGVTQVSARGDVSADMRSESLVFSTKRRSSRASTSTDPSVLAMSIRGGDLSGNLFLGETNIVRFHLEPTTVTLADDWHDFASNTSAQVLLAFAVNAGQFSGVLRLLAIPRLVGNIYSIFDMADSQQKVASQRSEIFKNTRAKRSTNPSPMTNVILQTARKTSMGGAATSDVKTAQIMAFDLKGIDIGVFNEDEDGRVADFYRFMLGHFEANLKRQMSADQHPKRDLKLNLSFVRWDTTDGARAAAKERKMMTARQLIDVAAATGRKEVASLPSMTLNMSSTEYADPIVLEYDFDLVWGETDGDIAILPNFFDRAIRASRKLMRGLDEQESTRDSRLGMTTASALRRASRTDTPAENEGAQKIEYRKVTNKEPGIPNLKMLGEGTRDTANLLPGFRAAISELGATSHRFVVLPLEEGMDLLLKLYEKQLPERTG